MGPVAARKRRTIEYSLMDIPVPMLHRGIFLLQANMLVQVMSVSYSISYTFGGSSVHYRKKSKIRLTVLAVCLILLLGLCTAFQGTFRELAGELFPWTKPEVKEAIGQLREDIQQGKPLVDAAQAFCKDILYGTETEN